MEIWSIEIQGRKKTIYKAGYDTRKKAEIKAEKILKKYPQAKCRIIKTDRPLSEVIKSGRPIEDYYDDNKEMITS